MSRRVPVLDPHVARELAELDAALAAEPAADADLALLVADVRAAAPRMSAAFAARLDERAEAGFARDARSRGGVAARIEAARARVAAWRAAARTRGLLLPALGVAATMLVALVVAVGVIAGRDVTPAGDTSATLPATAGGGSDAAVPSDAADPRDAKPSGEADSAAPQAADRHALPAAPGPTAVDRTGAGSFAAPAPVARAKGPGFGRKVEKSTQLSLRTSAGDVQDTADGVVRVVQSLGGVVASSQVTTTQSGGTATFSLRVPVARLDEAVRRLTALAHVASLTQSVEDITAGFVSTAERLSDARAERRALLRALGRATTANEIASLRARLRYNASEIATYKGRLTSLRRRADLARVEVTIEGHGREPGAGGGGAWTPGDALRDALRVLEVAAGVLLVAAAALAPVALVAALAALAARSLRRRRREQALDAAG